MPPASPKISSERLHMLGAPRPIRVTADGRGRPLAVAIPRGQLEDPAHAPFVRVASVQERWRIDDEWWRKEISRMYFRLELQGGRIVTVYQDLIAASWWLQNDTTPVARRAPIDVLAPRVETSSAVEAAEGTG